MSTEIDGILIRKTLIERVRKFWVEPFASSPGDIERLEFEPAARHPQSHELIPAREFPVEFITSGERLVFSGPAGAGKSFAMILHIVEARLKRAELDPKARVPVILNASTFIGESELEFDNTPREALARAFSLRWDIERRLFVRWVRRQLNARYGFRQREAQWLIDKDLIEYFIDGISEIGVDAIDGPPDSGLDLRTSFLAALEEGFKEDSEEEPEPFPVCLCVRREANGMIAFPGLPDFLNKYEFRTLEVSNLPNEVIFESVRPERYRVLLQAMRGRPELWKAADSPFVLNVFRVAYALEPDDLARPQVAATLLSKLLTSPIEALKERAIKRTFLRRWRFESEYPRRKAGHYLTKLARVAADKSKLFLTDLAQPTWLLPGSRVAYANLTSGLVALFVFFVLFLAVGGGQWWEWATMAGADVYARQVAEAIGQRKVTPLFLGAGTGLICGLLAAGIVFVGFRFLRKPSLVGLAFAVALTVSRSMMLLLSVPDGKFSPPVRAMRGGLVTLVIGGVFLIWLNVLRGHTVQKVAPLSNTQWGWHLAAKTFLAALAFSSFVLWLLTPESVFGLATGFSAVAAFIVAFSIPFSPRISLYPNYGIDRSRNMAAAFLIGSAIFFPPLVGLGYYASYLLYHDKLHEAVRSLFGWRTDPAVLTRTLSETLGAAWRYALTNGLLSFSFPVCAMIFGGIPLVQHYTLRALLYRDGELPFWLPKFCLEAAGNGILRRVGTGFQFDHEEMRAHFARRESLTSEDSTGKESSQDGL